MIYIEKKITPFNSSWWALCLPEAYLNGFVLPLGWEDELAARKIDFEIIEIEEDEPSDP